MIRKETGVSLRSVIGSFNDPDNDFDFIAIAYWLGKRKAGVAVAYEDVLQNFPSYADIGAIKVNVAMEDESEGDDDDPLPSEGPSTGPQ
jgi:hypothetical protein